MSSARTIGFLATLGQAILGFSLALSGNVCAQEQPNQAEPNNAPASQSTSDQSKDIAQLMKDDNQWAMAAKDYANTRFSKLDKINKNNVGQLQMAWSFSLGTPRGQEAAPLAIDGTIYVVGPYAGVHPNQVFALDADSGDLKWSYAPKPEPAAQGVACCDVVTRGLAYDKGKVFLNTLDGYSVAIDAATGKAVGTAALMRIDPAHGVIEIGSIAYSPLLKRSRAGTEAMFLFMRRVFDELGYRRYEWKCDSLNGPSRRAAERYGFHYEGTFRQAIVYKGRSRDTAWFSIIDRDWPAIRTAFERWLAPENFDAQRRQKKSLASLRGA